MDRRTIRIVSIHRHRVRHKIVFHVLLPPCLPPPSPDARTDTHDLLDNLRGRVQVDEALVDAHLEAVPGLGALTAGRLARRVLQHLGRQADGAFDAQLLVLAAGDEVAADCTARKRKHKEGDPASVAPRRQKLVGPSDLPPALPPISTDPFRGS